MHGTHRSGYKNKARERNIEVGEEIRSELQRSMGSPKRQSLDFVIMGGETGPGARPMEYDWAFSLSEQCEDAGIPFFYKYGPNDEGKVCKMPRLKGIVWDQIPDGN